MPNSLTLQLNALVAAVRDSPHARLLTSIKEQSGALRPLLQPFQPEAKK